MRASEGPAVVRTVGTRVAPDPARLVEFADALRHSSSPVLIYGQPQPAYVLACLQPDGTWRLAP